MKKLLLLVIVSLCVLSCLFAKGTKEPDKIKLTFVEVMTSPERTLILNQIISDYEASHPNIKIELQSPPYEQAENKLMMMLESGQTVDIAETRDNSIASFANNGVLKDLTPYISTWKGQDEMLDVALVAANAISDKPYLVPQYLYVKALLVRTDILEKAGIAKMPTTTAEFLEACKKVTDKSKGQYAFALRGKGNPCKTSDIMMITEVSNLNESNLYLTKDGEFYMSTPEGKMALENYKTLFTECCPPDSINWGYNEQINGFVSGTTPFLVQDPDAVGSISGLDPSQYTAIPMPVGNSGKRYLDYGFAGLSIPETSAHPQEAWDFITYMVSAEVNTKICEFYGALPVNKNAYETSPVFSAGVYDNWSAEMQDPNTVFVKFPLDDPKFTTYCQVNETTIQNYLLGKISVDDAIKTLKDFWGF